MPRQFSTDTICSLVDAVLPRGYHSLAHVAQLLRVRPRTFQRLLNQAGVRYSDIVEGCRRKAAVELIEHTQTPIREIAALVCLTRCEVTELAPS